jgi:hypothetical protein
MYNRLFFVLFLEPMQLLLCLVAVKLLTLKLRLKLAYLSFKFRRLSTKCDKLVSRQS